MRRPNSFRLTRRAALQNIAVSGAVAAIFPWLRTQSAHAGPIPTRLILWWQGSGVPRHLNTFKSAGGGAPTETDFVFPEIRSPLNAIKKDLIAFENLDMVSGTVDRTSPSNAHYEAETHCLSATNRSNSDTAGGPSIDQYIAKAINSPNPVTKVPSMSMAVACDGNTSYIKVCTPSSGQVIALDPSPSAAYKRLFTGFIPPATTPSVGPTAAEIAAQQRKSVLDMVLEDFKTVTPRLSKVQRDKLDAHASAIGDLEKRLAIGSGGGTFTPGASCKDPTNALLTGAGNAYPGTSTLYRKNMDVMQRLVQSGFACDLTRVALVGALGPFDDQYGYTSGAYGTTDSHDLIHKTSYNSAGSLKGNADAMSTITRLNQLESRDFIALVELLRSIPESDGNSMLDHTIVLWCSQIAEHGHAMDQLPWIIAGGKAAGFKPGRFLSYPRTNGKGSPHNNLFVSIAQAMGVQTETFGNPAVCTGPLARLRV
ncbi:MAG: DUF1552 domain-containing protein [Deltaproteobacteria bacterium]|nr:DUF1552 domain-containing protein [Deltaproteobacteria bacterium]